MLHAMLVISNEDRQMTQIIDMRTREKWKRQPGPRANGRPAGVAAQGPTVEAEGLRRGRNGFVQIGMITDEIVRNLAR